MPNTQKLDEFLTQVELLNVIKSMKQSKIHTQESIV
jgi:hypothetical protein